MHPVKIFTVCALAIGAVALASDSPNTRLLDPGTESPGLKIGEHAPDVTLVAPDGEEFDLSALYARTPLVVTFYRGGWCPYCNRALKAWAGRFDELIAAGGQFIAVTPETPENAIDTLENANAGYRVFIDPEGDIGKAFRIQFELDPETVRKYKGYGINLDCANASGRWELPAPATFVIDTEGVIRYVHAEWDFSTAARANPDEVIDAVRGLR